jgi:hypothetical protein
MIIKFFEENMYKISTESNMVKIDEHILDTFIVASDLTVDDLKSLGLLDLQKTVTGKPSFKPDKNLGEAKPTKDQLAYRTDLLNISDDYYEKELEILKQSDESLSWKVQSITNLMDTYEVELCKIAEKTLTDNYDNAVKVANEKLVALNIAPVTLSESDRKSLNALIDYQKINIHKWTEDLKNSTIDDLYRKEYWGVRYGKQTPKQ